MAAKAAVTIELPPLDIKRALLTLEGVTPLICHAWSHKAKAAMLAKQMKQAQPGKAAKDPFEDFVESLYWLSERPEELTPETVAQGTFGFKVIAFKAAAVTACTSVEGITKVAARQSFHVSGETPDLVRIEAPAPTLREDPVKIGMGTADLRYRAEFWPWRVTLKLEYNARALSLGQVFNLFNTAGFGVGVGEWRPERDGMMGRFKVATEADA